MKILSWNIWRGKHIEQVIEALRKINADVVGLQEVIVKYDEKVQTDYASIIADSLDYEYFFCKSFETDRHTPPYVLGNVLLCKKGMRNSQCRFLSSVEDYRGNAKTEPRTVVSCDVETGNKNTLSIFNTHLGHSPNLQTTDYQRKQADTLLDVVSKKSTLLMGDFNCTPDSDVILKVTEHFVHVDSNLNRPTRFEKRNEKVAHDRVDYMFASCDVRFSNFEIIETKASDHSILVVDVEV